MLEFQVFLDAKLGQYLNGYFVFSEHSGHLFYLNILTFLRKSFTTEKKTCKHKIVILKTWMQETLQCYNVAS